MKVNFWGTRGSIAKPGPSTLRFGGNTSCVEVRSASGTLVILDCGTGAHGLGQALLKAGPHPLRGHILITHTHWDHIQGFPFFTPLFVPGNRWDVYGPSGLGPSLRDALAGQMQYTYFPVTLDGLGATIRYHDLVEGQFEIDDITVYTRYMNHPALTLGYRLEADGVSVVYACDHEPHTRRYALGDGVMGAQDQSHVEFMKKADLVIHDAQYTSEEDDEKIGWGHTPVECAVDMCRAAEARRLALTHHDPLRDDAGVDGACEQACASQLPACRSLEVFAAAEGMALELESTSPERDSVESTQALQNAAIQPALTSKLVLIAVADTGLATTLQHAVRADHLEVATAATLDEVKAAIRKTLPVLVLLDGQISGGDAVSACRAIRELDVDRIDELPLVVVTDSDTDIPSESAVTDWLVHPFSLEYTRTRVRAWVMRGACNWQRAALPVDESRRLAAIEALQILDSEPEERFDQITRIAAAAFDVPIALVSVVDRERQWFKSRFGLAATQTPRDQAFCAHAILDSDVMVVRDTLRDTRFADNPLVTGDPRIRFYAGYPLSLPDGSFVGTLCLIDTRPRDLDDVKIDLLRSLGKLVEREMGAG